MNHRHESSDNFSNIFEYMNSCQHSSSESINKLDTTEESNNIHEPEPEPESRSNSNSVTSDDIDNCTITHKIPIPIKFPKRKRETMCNGMSAHDLYGLTPTPTKYRNMIEENAQNIGSLITKYYEEVE